MKLFYREYGKGNPIVILHGLLGSSDNWLPQAKVLGDQYRVFAVDQRNHGQSPHSDQFTYQVMVNDLKNFIEEHQLVRPVIIGHSMGGKVAMNFSLMHPDLLDKLIVVDIAPKPYDVRHDHIVEGLKALPVQSIKSRQEADEALAIHIAQPAVRQFLLKNLMRTSDGGFAWRINLPVIDKGMQAISDGLLRESTYSGQVLFIRGDRSDYILNSDSEVIKKYFPAAEVVSMNTGHWVQAEKPEEFVEVVSKFLKGTP